jgi:hypothetical protein
VEHAILHLWSNGENPEGKKVNYIVVGELVTNREQKSNEIVIPDVKKESVQVYLSDMIVYSAVIHCVQNS